MFVLVSPFLMSLSVKSLLVQEVSFHESVDDLVPMSGPRRRAKSGRRVQVGVGGKVTLKSEQS